MFVDKREGKEQGEYEGVSGGVLDQFLNLNTRRATSEINGVTYPPWNNADLSEFRSVSALSEDYEDPVGVISLSSEQKTRLGAWLRPHEICDHPKMIHLISSLTIKQVGHCIICSSLTLCPHPVCSVVLVYCLDY